MNEPAKWTLHPTSERELVEESRKRTAARRWAWTLGLTSLGFCPLTCLGLGGAFTDRGGLWLLIPTAALVGTAFAYLRHSAGQARRDESRRAALDEEYAPVGGWIVDLAVYQGAAPTGRDRGAVWFEDDRLLFSGRRTSFALARGEAFQVALQGWLDPDLGSNLHLVLQTRTEAGSVALGFSVVPKTFIPSSQGEAALHGALKGWLANASPSEGGLPPLAVGPGAPSPERLLRAALGVTAFWAAFAGLGLWFGVVSGAPAACVAMIVAIMLLMVWSGLWVPRLRWRAYRDRRRLERSQWKT